MPRIKSPLDFCIHLVQRRRLDVKRTVKFALTLADAFRSLEHLARIDAKRQAREDAAEKRSRLPSVKRRTKAKNSRKHNGPSYRKRAAKREAFFKAISPPVSSSSTEYWHPGVPAWSAPPPERSGGIQYVPVGDHGREESYRLYPVPGDGVPRHVTQAHWTSLVVARRGNDYYAIYNPRQDSVSPSTIQTPIGTGYLVPSAGVRQDIIDRGSFSHLPPRGHYAQRGSGRGRGRRGF